MSHITNYYITAFKPLNSLVLNTAGEFTYMAPLSGNIKDSFACPPITTCIGAFTTLLLSSSSNKNLEEFKKSDWLTNIEKLLNEYNIEEIYGVNIIIESNNKNYEHYYYIGGSYFVKKDALSKIFKIIKNLDPTKNIKENIKELIKHFRKKDTLSKILEEFINKNCDEVKNSTIKAIYSDKIGIELNEEKITEPGKLFFTKYVDYISCKNNKSIINDMKFIIYLKVKNEIDKLESCVRFGGEGRIANVSIEKCSQFIEMKKWKEFGKTSEDIQQLNKLGFNCYIKVYDDDLYEIRLLTSHLILPEIEDSPIMEEKVNSIMESIGLRNEEDLIWGTINYIAGYDIARNIRKPMYIALEPGTIIIKNKK